MTVLSPLPPFQEKNLGPSRRSQGTPRPPGVNKGGRIPPQHGGRAGMGRTSRSWEDSPGEQPRGGAGGRGRRGRGRGSPHLSGDASTADRKSKVGAERGLKSALSPLGGSVLSCCCFYSQMDFLLHPSFTVSPFSDPRSGSFSPLPFLPLSPRPALWVLSLSLSLSPVSRSAGCLWHLPSLPFVSFWCRLVGSAQRACARAFVISVRVCTCSRSLSFPELVGREW